MHTNNPTSLQQNSLSDINYRSPVLNEIEFIYDFFHTTLTNNFPMFPMQALQTYKKAWTIKKIEERIKINTDLLLLAWDKNVPIGLISGSLPEGGVGTIIWMMVEKKYRFHKIGSTLFFYGKNFYKNLGCHKIKLTAPSIQAKEFYLKQGMIIEGYHTNHWWNVDFWSLAKII